VTGFDSVLEELDIALDRLHMFHANGYTTRADVEKVCRVATLLLRAFDRQEPTP
jgi:hypothetical protein